MRLYKFVKLFLLSLSAMLCDRANAGTLVPPFALNYTKTPIGSGLIQYDFTLTDVALSPGTGVGWFVFGDKYWDGSGGYGNLPLWYGAGVFSTYPGEPQYTPDFTMISAVPAPWTDLGWCSGGHNGPSFDYVFAEWFPNIGDSLQFSGISHTDVPAGHLLYSFLVVSGSQPAIQFQVANEVPEPGGCFLLIGAVMISGLFRRLRVR